jgi:predicted DsbA family dithiol-disulfide isomerase
MISRMGSERATRAQKHMESLGTSCGIAFDFSGTVSNSHASHMLLHFAVKWSGPRVQTEVAERLFAAQFEQKKDISDFQTLMSIAEFSGLQRVDVGPWLKDVEGKGSKELEEEERRVKERSKGKGVPQFIVKADGERKLEFDGAVDAMEWLEGLIGVKEGKGSEESGNRESQCY